MSEHDEIEPGLRELDRRLQEEAAPGEDRLRRVRGRLLAAIDGDGGPAARWLRRRWPVVAAAAAAVLLVAIGVAGGAALAGRGGGSNGVATVVPGTGSGQASGGQDAGGAPIPYSGSGVAAGRQAPTAGSTASQPYPIVTTACPSGPTVQLQSRGLVVTGVGVIPTSGSGSSTITFSVSVQEQGSDQAALTTKVQTRLAAVQSALDAAGVPRANVEQTSLSSYGSSNTQATVYGSIEARLSSQDQLTAVTRAVAQQGGTASYSSSTNPGGDPSAQDVQTAVSAAAGQARDMAATTARATNQTLGAVQGVVTQPPQLCYGPSGPQRVVQVTVTYALK
jgi:uncharacterized protein DUF541